MKKEGSNSYTLFICCCFSLLVLVAAMAEATGSAETGSKVIEETAAVHIVYVERPEGEEPEAYHVRTLTSVLGSEEAAREALIYSYKTAASGFSAKLTPGQVSEISKKPGVLQVMPNTIHQLHSGQGKLHG